MEWTKISQNGKGVSKKEMHLINKRDFVTRLFKFGQGYMLTCLCRDVLAVECIERLGLIRYIVFF